MTIPSFSIARLPRVEFGRGVVAKLPALLSPYGKKLLLVTGRRAFVESEHWSRLAGLLRSHGFAW